MGSRLPFISRQNFCDQLHDAVHNQPTPYFPSRPSIPSTASSSVLKPDDGFEELCFEHYSELQRWNPRISLIGPGTASEVIQRHYAESLAALPLFEEVVIEKSVSTQSAESKSAESKSAESKSAESKSAESKSVESKSAESKSGEDRVVPTKILLVDLGSGGGFPGLILATAYRRIEAFLVEPREKKWNFLRAAVRRCSLSCRGLSCHCLDGRVGDRRDDSALPKGLPEKIDVVTCRALALSRLQFELIQEHSPAVRFFLWQGGEPPELPGSLQVRREVPLAGSQKRRILEIVPT